MSVEGWKNNWLGVTTVKAEMVSNPTSPPPREKKSELGSL